MSRYREPDPFDQEDGMLAGSAENGVSRDRPPQDPDPNTRVQMPSEAIHSDAEADVRILLFFSLGRLPRSGKFLVCSACVFFFYLIYGYFMELIFRLKGFRPFGWYLTLIQFACYAIFGFVEIWLKSEWKRRTPLKMYALIAFFTVATMGLSNSSMGYLNFPTQQIFKSCKLIPVMLGGIFIQGKRYSAIDFVACFFMCMGLALFTVADSTVSPNFNIHGIVLISLALCADAVIGNVQEKAMKQYNSSNTEMVFYSYSIGFLYILFALIISGQFTPAFQFCLKHPKETYGYAMIFSIAGFLGLLCVLILIKLFGALLAVTVTTCRKALTIVLSFVFFTKPFTYQYLWSGFIVVMGIYLNIYSKNRTTWNKTLGGILMYLKPWIFQQHRRFSGRENVV